MTKKAEYNSPRELLKYHIALGAFIDTFSFTEEWVKRLLWQELKAPEEIARAVFSKVSVAEAIALIGKLHEAQEIKIDPVLEKILTHIDQINTERNAIVHYGARVDDDRNFVVSNKGMTDLKRKIKEKVISADMVNRMTNDLDTISIALEPFFMRHKITHEQFIHLRDQAKPGTWLYKSAQQPKKARPHRKSGTRR